VEYALIAAIVGLGTAAAMRSLASGIASAFTTLGSRLTASV